MGVMDKLFVNFITTIGTLVAVNGLMKEFGDTKEYCLGDVFNPECSEDTVIVMHTARYGHINIGKCIDIDTGGPLGCYVDQLSAMDKSCSGRQSCEVIVSDTLMEGDFPCTMRRSFVRYLEASYVCIKVYSPQKGECRSSGDISATSRFQYLSSMTTEEKGCGVENKPWIIHVKNGQKINITFTDFNWKLTSRDEAKVNCPMKYGYMLDDSSNDIVNLCGGLIRERNLYISKGNKLQIFLSENVLGNVKFLIGYKAIGCPTYTPGKHMWTKEKDDHISVGCLHSDDSWKMRCIGNHWLGPIKDCSKYSQSEGKSVASKSLEEDNKVLNMPPTVAFALLGGIALVFASIIVTVVIGIFCMRKSNGKSKFDNTQKTNKSPVVVPVDAFATYRSVHVRLPKKQDQVRGSLKQEDPFGSLSTLGTVPRHPPGLRESPHYYLLEGRDTTETEPLYDVVYQGSPEDQ